MSMSRGALNGASFHLCHPALAMLLIFGSARHGI